MSDSPAAVARIAFAPGGMTGMAIPAHPDALIGAGPEFLTRAFRAYGALAQDNAVTRIVEAAPHRAGNSGDKLALRVEYARSEPDLPRALFVKFSRCFGDPFRDRRRHELEAEVRLAALSRLPAFPVAVARPLFADCDAQSGTGILITETIQYGADGIEPARGKNRDDELANPAEYYRATLGAPAKLAAAHKSGRLSPQLEELFPFDADVAMADLPVAWSEAELRAKCAALRDFARRYPQLLPPDVAAPAFVGTLEAQALALLQNDGPIRRFLYSDADLIALAHWNTHIDNAWFWRDEIGTLQAGLLDWGMVCQRNLGIALWGGLSGARVEMLDAHLDSLLDHFAQVLASEGGPRIEPERLGLHFDMSVAMVGMALLLDAPALLLSRMPDIGDAASVDDPLLARDKVVQGFLHTARAWLHLWQRRDFGTALERMLAE